MSTVTLAAVRLRAARPRDVRGLYALIRHYSDLQILLPRTEQDLLQTIGNFRVISSKNRLLACAVLHFYTPKVAELRSLAVAPEAQGTGLGRALVEALLEEARRRGLDMVFAFTYEVKFFQRMGFAPIEREQVPWKAWRDCAVCPKQGCCDETAVAYWLKPKWSTPVSIFRIIP